MTKFKTPLAIILIIGLILPNASFALIGDVVEVANCSLLNGIIGRFIGRLVDRALSVVGGAIRAGLSLIGLGFLLGPEPVEVKNQDIEATQAKELFKDAVSRCIARQILSSMNRGIINLARKTGREGGPTFVQNWRNFTTTAQYRGEDVFRAMLSNTKLCDHFENKLKQTFNAQTKISLSGQNTRMNDLDLYALRAGCTMPSGWSLENYQRDFAANGGWEAFAKLMEPQNNAFGSLLLAMEEAEKQRNFEQQIDILETQGHGFTSKRGDNAVQGCKLRGPSGRCLIYNEVETPAEIIKELSVESLKSELQWVIGVDELNELVMNMYNVLINRLTDFSGRRLLNESLPPIEGDPNLDDDIPQRTPYPTSTPEPTSTPTSNPNPTPNPNANPNWPNPPGVCASDAQIAQFLIDNPGDQARLPSAFPCN